MCSPTGEPYQHSWVGSSFLRCQGIPEQTTWQSGLLDVRQYHSSIVHQAGRQDLLRLTWLTIGLLKFCDQKRIIDSCTHTGPLQLSSGQFVMTGRDTYHGVVNRSRTVTCVQTMGVSIDMPVCHIQQPKMLAISGSPYQDPRAAFINAISIQWNWMGTVYTFPPFKMIPSVIAKLRQSHSITMILLAPYW